MTDQTSTLQPDEPKPIWSRTWFSLLAGMIFVGLIILADQFGEAGNAEWSMIFALALGLSAAQFWGKRSRWWFWPSVVGIALVHGAMLLHWKWTTVPSPGAVNLKGAVFGDLALDCAWLWWMGWLFDPHAKPRTTASIQVEIISYVFVVVMIGVVALTWWGIDKRQKDIMQHSHVVEEVMSTKSSSALKSCFFDGPHSDNVWSTISADHPTERMSDAIFHTSVIIADLGSKRRIQITTLDGKPLPKSLVAAYSRCLN